MDYYQGSVKSTSPSRPGGNEGNTVMQPRPVTSPDKCRVQCTLTIK